VRYKFLPLPPDFDPIDATVDEVASWRRESRWTVHKKIREGRFERRPPAARPTVVQGAGVRNPSAELTLSETRLSSA
jgi:hypothetical protein